MKKDLHPKNYRPVVFQDTNDGTTFVSRSTAETDETILLDGAEYPLVKIHISSSSHPYFTGQEKLVDVEGRVDKYKARLAAAKAAREAKAAAKPKARKARGEKTKTKSSKKTADS